MKSKRLVEQGRKINLIKNINIVKFRQSKRNAKKEAQNFIRKGRNEKRLGKF